MNNINDLFTNLIAYTISHNNCVYQKESLSTDIIEELISLFEKHNITAIVGSALLELDLIANAQIQTKIQDKLCETVCFYEKMHYEYQWICRILEAAQIPFMPLKGAVVRQYYPEPWMRVSGDIDILIAASYLDKAVSVLLQNGCIQEHKKRFHDIPLVTPGGILLELHFGICENITPMDSVLEKVWDYAEPIHGKQYEYRLNDTFFLFHMLAHMAYHFLNGGCGLRSFVDILLLEQNLQYDKKLFESLCQKASLGLFYKNVNALNQVWFFGKSHSDTSKMLEDFVISGGVFGNRNNRILMEQAQTGSKNKHTLYRIFKPYSELSVQYPSLKHKPWLSPAYQVFRWIRVFTDRRYQKVKSELQIGHYHSDLQINKTKELLKNVGLNNDC